MDIINIVLAGAFLVMCWREMWSEGGDNDKGVQ